jgi:hypothetical protein
MLKPEYLGNIPQPIEELFQELENFIITDVARRLKKAGNITSSAEWQLNQAALMNIKNVEAKIQETLKLSQKQIEELFPEVAATTIESENIIYKAAGYKTIDLSESKMLRDYLKNAIKTTKGDIENITQSLGFAENQGGKVVYNSLAKFYQKELNVAHIKVQSGVLDYNTAIKQAVRKIADSGVRQIVRKKGVPQVEYDSGYSINIDSAARRAVLTSVHQFNQETINHMMNDIVPPNEQYAETTAHFPCRPTHLPWQGRVFKVVGSEPGYPNLVEETQLGSVQGLEGIGCRHSYYTFLKGASVRTYTDKQLEEMEKQSKEKFNYKGENYTPYEATQYQRQLENDIRKLKREKLAYEETGLDADAKATNRQIKALRQEYKEFSQKAGIRAKLERTQI